MKFAWRNNIPDLATWNSAFVEEVDDFEEFRELLDCDDWQEKLDSDGLELQVEHDEHQDPFAQEDGVYLVD
jgi:hypothetical protein